jgi:heme exporter protein D
MDSANVNRQGSSWRAVVLEMLPMKPEDTMRLDVLFARRQLLREVHRGHRRQAAGTA